MMFNGKKGRVHSTILNGKRSLVTNISIPSELKVRYNSTTIRNTLLYNQEVLSEKRLLEIFLKSTSQQNMSKTHSERKDVSSLNLLKEITKV